MKHRQWRIFSRGIAAGAVFLFASAVAAEAPSAPVDAPAAGAAASAAPDQSQSSAGTEPLWELFFAGFARYGPTYPGASDSQLNVVPLPFPRYRGKFLRVGEETGKPLRGRIFRRDRIKLDLDFGLNFPVDSEEVAIRNGMPDLDLLLEAGPELSMQFVDHLPSRWAAFLNLGLRAAFSWPGLDPRFQGVVFSPELKFRKRFSADRRDELNLRITSSFGSSDYMDYFYGVDNQYVAPGRSAYDAHSGYLGTELAISIRKPLASRYELVTGIRVALQSGASNHDSPLLQEDVTVGIFGAFLWKFWESKRRAPVLD